MTPSSPTTASQTLRERREAAGLSREGLAYKAGVSVKTVERIEAGKVVPRRATMAVIEGALANGDGGDVVPLERGRTRRTTETPSESEQKEVA